MNTTLFLFKTINAQNRAVNVLLDLDYAHKIIQTPSDVGCCCEGCIAVKSSDTKDIIEYFDIYKIKYEKYSDNEFIDIEL